MTRLQKTATFILAIALAVLTLFAVGCKKSSNPVESTVIPITTDIFPLTVGHRITYTGYLRPIGIRYKHYNRDNLFIELDCRVQRHGDSSWGNIEPHYRFDNGADPLGNSPLHPARPPNRRVKFFIPPN